MPIISIGCPKTLGKYTLSVSISISKYLIVLLKMLKDLTNWPDGHTDFVPEHFHLMRDNHKAAMDTIEKELTVNQLIAGSCPAAGVN